MARDSNLASAVDAPIASAFVLPPLFHIARVWPGRPQHERSAWQKLVLILSVFVAGCGCTDRGTKPELACFNNLRNIDTAEQVWAMENHKTTNDTPSWGDLQKFLYSTNMICPARGTYNLARISEPPTCSIPAHAALYSKNRGRTWSPNP
jgi:hypothetical protein